MEEALAPLFFFWIPLFLFGIGVSLTFFTKSSRFVIPLIIVGIIGLLSSPITVPNSDSSAVGKLLLDLLIPSTALLGGLYIIIFSGNVPVQRISKTYRPLGFLLSLFSMTYLCIMHWHSFTPMWRGQANPYWIIFWPTFLLASASFTALFSMILVTIGRDRGKNSIHLFLISVFTTLITLLAMSYDGNITTAEQFRDYIWMAAADIFGIIVGCLLAIFAFTIVIAVYEKSMPEPTQTSPPTKEEWNHVESVLSRHLGGIEDE
ncbi:MAG: hypothetical protein CMA25_04400 [Euryarchaeota archaeon]|nr:hypothetical protein [Euryarchaeota archaeon]